MSESKHTPGPWNFTGNGVYAKDGTTIADNEAYNPYPLDPRNGHLIAAAPELLEALEAVEAWWFNGETDANVHMPNQLADVIHAAITKAKGLPK